VRCQKAWHGYDKAIGEGMGEGTDERLDESLDEAWTVGLDEGME
jgi:hypothetical protein